MSALAMSALPCRRACWPWLEYVQYMRPVGEPLIQLRRDLRFFSALTFPTAGPTKKSITAVNDTASLATAIPCHDV